MTKLQIAIWMSSGIFRGLVAALGLIVGLIVARLLWGKYVELHKSEIDRQYELGDEVAETVARNRRLQVEVARLEKQLATRGVNASQDTRNGSITNNGSLPVEFVESTAKSDKSETGSSCKTVVGTDKRGVNDDVPVHAPVQNVVATENSKKSADDEKDFVLPFSGGPVVDWSQVTGVSPELVQELNRVNAKNPEQLEGMTQADKAKFESQLASKGIAWEWGWLTDWKSLLIAGTVGAGATMIHTDSNSKIDSPSRAVVKNVPTDKVAESYAGPKTASSPQLQESFGTQVKAGDTSGAAAAPKVLGFSQMPDDIKSDHELAPSQTVTDGSVSGDNASNSNAKTADEKMRQIGDWAGSAIRVKPAEEDSIFQPGSLTNFAGKKKLGDQKYSLPVSESVEVLSESLDVSQSETADRGIPQDDLTLLEGISGAQVAALKKYGIRNFQQLQRMTDNERDKFQRALERRGIQLCFDQWRIVTALPGSKIPLTEDIRERAGQIRAFRESEELDGGDWTDREQAEWELRGNPIFNFGVSHKIDDFVGQASADVSQEAQEELYRMGLFNEQQIQRLTAEQRNIACDWFARFDKFRDFDMGAMFKSAVPPLADVLVSKRPLDYGPIYAARPEHADDLTRIDGISESTENALNQIGVFTFDQIAGWSTVNQEAIARTLRIDEETIRLVWIPGARRYS